jgi:hypothetical protein
MMGGTLEYVVGDGGHGFELCLPLVVAHRSEATAAEAPSRA